MKKTIQVVLVTLILALFIGACMPAVPAQQAQQAPQAQNTQSLQDTQSQINTSVAQTVEAQNQIGTSVALTTEAQITPSPTATLFTIPTLTPFVILTPTNVPSSGGSSGGGAPAKAEYSCDVIRLRPTAYAEYLHGQKFDIKMTVINNGTRAWYQGFDVKYVGGPKMTTVTRIELPAMAPGARHEIVLDAVAPDKLGNQTMTWAVDGRLCFGYVTIKVK
jgi:hypothetical protein